MFVDLVYPYTSNITWKYSEKKNLQSDLPKNQQMLNYLQYKLRIDETPFQELWKKVNDFVQTVKEDKIEAIEEAGGRVLFVERRLGLFFVYIPGSNHQAYSIKDFEVQELGSNAYILQTQKNKVAGFIASNRLLEIAAALPGKCLIVDRLRSSPFYHGVSPLSLVACAALNTIALKKDSLVSGTCKKPYRYIDQDNKVSLVVTSATWKTERYRQEAENELKIGIQFRGKEGCAELYGYALHRLGSLMKTKIVMRDYNYGDLFGLIEKNTLKKKFSLKERVKFIYFGILKGLQTLHDNNLVYHDLKPENVFIAGNASSCETVLGDFGKITRQQDGNPKSFRGSRLYFPPELVRYQLNLPHYDIGFEGDIGGPLGDIWRMSFTISLAEDLACACKINANQTKFENNSDYQALMEAFVKFEGDLDSGIKQFEGSNCPLRYLLAQGMQKEPRKRPTLKQFEEVFTKIINETNTSVEDVKAILINTPSPLSPS